jgi:competence protein ComGC
MKKLVVILIFILLLVFFLQLYANKSYSKRSGKEAMTETKNATAIDHFEKKNCLNSTKDDDLWPSPQTHNYLPKIAIFQGSGDINDQTQK